MFSAGPIRRALEATAGAAGLDGDAVSDYLDAVRSIVREMAAHGRGGILIVSHEEQPQVAESATYKMALDSSLAALLRLVRRIKWKQDVDPAVDSGRLLPSVDLLRNALLTEVERVIEEFGALTGIDGAILLNRDLALMAFGVILPVGRPTAVAEAVDAEGLHGRIIDLGSRGTRHRAGVTYAGTASRERGVRGVGGRAGLVPVSLFDSSIRCACGGWGRPTFTSHESTVIG